ncbi:MAG: helix-hairpin-helix domain-containing protein [Bacteroidaceae bacterium]|nr:helix-hairpin-helix domain-containing protein [Bacteroidaceae bacterium]
MKRRGWFTRSQLWFLLIVLNACLVLMGAIFLSRYRTGKENSIAQIQNVVYNASPVSVSSRYYAVDTSLPESFTFDPNEADSTQLLRLGLAPFQVRSIYRYRAKGGRFSTKDDFRRVYRLTNEQWEHLSPLIRIAKKYQLVDLPQQKHYAYSQPYAEKVARDDSQDSIVQLSDTLLQINRSKQTYPVKLSGDETMDINTADSAQLCRVPGIGPYFARQIIKYRRQLGGYVATEQLLQIENFPADAIAWLVISDTVGLQRLNVNKLSTRKLMKHPYMGYYRASDIENHKRIYGRVENIDALRKMPHFTDEDIRRLLPYLEF